MFIFHGTMETLSAADIKGKTFTQILSSVCKQNGGAVDILEIEKLVFGSYRSPRRGDIFVCMCPRLCVCPGYYLKEKWPMRFYCQHWDWG